MFFVNFIQFDEILLYIIFILFQSNKEVE